MKYLIFYLAGVLQDFCLTLNWRYIAKDKPLLATIFSFLTSIVSLIVLYSILTQLDSERSLIASIIYALGIATGTYLGMKNKFGMTEKIPKVKPSLKSKIKAKFKSQFKTKK